MQSQHATGRLDPGFYSPEPPRLAALDGLRGIAILAVLLYHTWSMGVLSTSAAESRGWLYSVLAGMGWMGVDLFFVLSGFLITGILYDTRARRNYYRVFYARRALRVFPLYYASLIALLVLIPPLVTTQWSARMEVSPQWPAWLYLLNWTRVLKPQWTVTLLVGHFWSLCVEEQFYMAWPWVVKSFTRKLPYLLIGMFFGALLLRAGVYAWGYPRAAYVLTFCRADSLALGALVALAYRGKGWRRLQRSAPVLLGACGLALALLVGVTKRVEFGRFPIDTAGITLAGLISASLLVIVLGTPQGSMLSKTMTSPLLRTFGLYSYGIYILHLPLIRIAVNDGVFQQIVDYVPQPALGVIAMNSAAIGASLAAGWLSWNLLEKHFLRFKDNRWASHMSAS